MSNKLGYPYSYSHLKIATITDSYTISSICHQNITILSILTEFLSLLTSKFEFGQFSAIGVEVVDS